ncbi:hypothetical protein E4U13_001029 [Claviceps humidiphila]|uniref:Uncharacterized protein n=1 Tax=Claviceps humidiphila TaxID=1294629 RepID=A0A9P7Q3F4_9HYPO|nr:hypothetical protein E4U13_001029 [Claviceps humidiphila]
MKRLKSSFGHILPSPQKSSEGRDQWRSRTAFLLAAMGGCAGMGNLLRYPSQVFNNHGLQWFIPYLLCVFLIAIPVLLLELAIGQAYRGGCVVANNSIHHRLKGLGLSLLYVGFVISPYFVVNLAWVMRFFRGSFQKPLPWAGRSEAFFYEDVVANVEPVPGFTSDDKSKVLAYTSYPGVGMVAETVGWTVFTWFLVWASIFRGVGVTGRVVYFTMGLSIVMTIILVGRSLSLEHASRGVKLFWATWDSKSLASGEMWQTACGQVFFSTGVGFGYFTSCASYNKKYSNAVMDSILIVASNVLFENIAAFAVYGVVGFLGISPKDGVRLGSFTVGFITLPSAVAQMPGANFWAVMLFLTLMVMGYSSAFAMVDAIVTLIMDAQPRWNRSIVVTWVVAVFFLLSLPYCTEFGYPLLTAVDRWINDVALVFVVWAECAMSTTVYRWRDVVGQVGLTAFTVYNTGYFGGMILGIVISQVFSYALGTGIGLGFFIGNQLRRDLNEIISSHKNWQIPSLWAPILRYIAAPILAIVYGFSYPSFYALRVDPLHILGFVIGHIALLLIGFGFMVPRWLGGLIPPERRGEGKLDIGANVLLLGNDESETSDDAASKGTGVDTPGE